MQLLTWKRFKKYQTRSGAGLTLIELLVVVAIIALLVLILLWLLTRQIPKGRDSQRKADLEKIKISFEDYYNDYSCYPPPEVLEDCRGSSFRPYLDMIPCDPLTNEPYYYVPLAEDACAGYRVYASLEDSDDPIIEELQCNTSAGCGFGAEYNYGVAAGLPVAGSESGGAGGGGGAGTVIFVYACDSAGTCNRYQQGHPALVNCPTTFPNPGCAGQCGNPNYWCE